MKKIFERIISKFKEFWCNRKNVSRSYFYNGEYHICKSSDKKHNPSIPLKFMISNMRGLEIGGYFEDINVHNKRKHCIYVRKKSENSDIKIQKKFIYFWEIIGKSKFNFFDSDRIDIDFWSHEAGIAVMVKRKVIVISVSEVFMN